MEKSMDNEMEGWSINNTAHDIGASTRTVVKT